MPGRQPAPGARTGRSGRSKGNESTKDKLTDLVQLIIAYAKQEALDPVLKQLKALVKAVAGATLIAMGTVLLALGFVRALQSEFGGAGNGTRPVISVMIGRGAPASGGGFVAFGGPYGLGAHLSGDWSWAPYMGGALFALLVGGVCVFRLLKGGPTQ